MIYRLILHKNVIRFLRSRPPGEKILISKRLDLLKENPYNHPELDIKKIAGVDNIFRLRVGRIRILYTVKEVELLILLMVAASRGDIYKKR